MSAGEDVGRDLSRAARRLVPVAALGVLVLAGGAVLDFTAFLRAYLPAFLLVLGLGLGCLAIDLLHNLTAGAWGFATKRVLHAGAGTIPLLALLFLPILLGVHSLYEWSHAEVVAADPVLQHKSAYLNVPFFALRAALYFFLWVLLAFVARRGWSRFQDSWDPQAARRLRRVSAPGLALYCLSATFAAVDWGMSLEPHWFSTIYGVHFFVGQVLAALAATIVVSAWLSRRTGLLGASSFHDLGNLLLAFIMLWAYVSFSQFLIIWSGNLPEETPWYLHRVHSGWQFLALVLVVFHFAVPFLLLLSRRNKRRAGSLALIAGGVLLMRWFDLFWVIGPAFHTEGFSLSWMDPVAAATLASVWLLAFLQRLAREPLPVERDGGLPARFEQEAAA